MGRCVGHDRLKRCRPAHDVPAQGRSRPAPSGVEACSPAPWPARPTCRAMCSEPVPALTSQGAFGRAELALVWARGACGLRRKEVRRVGFRAARKHKAGAGSRRLEARIRLQGQAGRSGCGVHRANARRVTAARWRLCAALAVCGGRRRPRKPLGAFLRRPRTVAGSSASALAPSEQHLTTQQWTLASPPAAAPLPMRPPSRLCRRS